MTVEEIRAEIDRHIDKCAVNGFNLMCSILGYIKRLLDDLEPTWHPYPEERPSKYGNYLVTCDDSDVLECRWDSDLFEELGVVAWTELPKPYKKEEE